MSDWVCDDREDVLKTIEFVCAMTDEEYEKHLQEILEKEKIEY
ncbi:MAG: hypothetical protein ACI4CT_07375 [Lachnospiraceae bacterium]